MSSAQVISREIDFSTRIPSFPGVYGVMVLPARKGSTNPTLVTSETDLLNKFTPKGEVEIRDDQGYFSAINFLSKSNKLWIIRAIKEALYGGVAIVSEGSTTGSSTSLTTGLTDPTSYSFDSVTNTGEYEVTNITCVADVAQSLQGKYFLINSPSAEYAVWLNVDSLGSAPSVVGKTLIEVAISENATDIQVAQAIASALNAEADFSAPAPATAILQVTNVSKGDVVDASDVDSGFSFSVETQGVDVDDSTEALLLYGSSEGAFSNDIRIKIFNYDNNPNTVKEPDAFIIQVFDKSNLNSALESFTCSRIEGKKDGNGRNIFVEDVLLSSNYIRGYSNRLVDENIQPAEVTDVALGGGDDGLAVTDSEMITSLEKISNPEEYFTTLILDGGWTTSAYHSKIVEICENRQDCLGILSTPYSTEVTTDPVSDIVDYRRVTLNKSTSWASLYTPHLRIYDKFNDRNIYVAPDGFVGSAISGTSINQEIWYAPAGNARGQVNALDTRVKFNKSQRDVLYDAGVNPIKFQSGQGIIIWGQKTLQSRPSATDRISTRMALIVIRSQIALALNDFVFEFNDETTRTRISSVIESFMESIKARRGVEDFSVKCDTENNPGSVIDNNELVVWVFVRPKGVAEVIRFTTIITNSTISFEEASTALGA